MPPPTNVLTYVLTVVVILLLLHAVRCERNIGRQREMTGERVRETLRHLNRWGK
ncbi:hypothetical protein [Streptomyces sp. sk226]|uniref:hypothetical protein n=1 Tax=Streptomyces sp. sk226 TaxID=2034268 RepID=UPI0015CF06EA|nr:hypothetical protein [Streptomyces sp. sk226]